MLPDHGRALVQTLPLDSLHDVVDSLLLTRIDYLSRVEYTVAEEAEFGVQMPDEKKDVTFGDLIKVLEGSHSKG